MAILCQGQRQEGHIVLHIVELNIIDLKMSKGNKPTLKQRVAFNNTLKAIETGEGLNMGEIMKKSGYSVATAINPELNLTSRPGWKQLMDAFFQDEKIAEEIQKIAFGDDDKRAKLAAIDMMLKLKGKYPINKLRLEGANNELNNILNVDDTTGGSIQEADKI